MGGVREGKISKQNKLVLRRSRGLNSNLLLLVQEYVRVGGLDRLQRKLMDSNK